MARLSEQVDVSGQRFLLIEVSVQQWRDGQILREKFYYNTITKIDSVSSE